MAIRQLRLNAKILAVRVPSDIAVGAISLTFDTLVNYISRGRRISLRLARINVQGMSQQRSLSSPLQVSTVPWPTKAEATKGGNGCRY